MESQHLHNLDASLGHEPLNAGGSKVALTPSLSHLRCAAAGEGVTWTAGFGGFVRGFMERQRSAFHQVADAAIDAMRGPEDPASKVSTHKLSQWDDMDVVVEACCGADL